MNSRELKKAIKEKRVRSAWQRGVKDYALDLIDEIEYYEDYSNERGDYKPDAKLHSILLNGAADWHEYSWGGCSKIYNSDIAYRLCTESELKITDNGRKPPNKSEQWLDTQARALFQAEKMIMEVLE